MSLIHPPPWNFFSQKSKIDPKNVFYGFSARPLDLFLHFLLSRVVGRKSSKSLFGKFITFIWWWAQYAKYRCTDHSIVKFRFSAITGGWQKIWEDVIFVKCVTFACRTQKNSKYRCTEHSIVKFRFSAGYKQISMSFIPLSWRAENPKS